MVDRVEDELTKLELLSNTAMLRKVMDKEGEDGGNEGDSQPRATLVVSMPNTRLEESSTRQREGEGSFTSPHWERTVGHGRSQPLRFASMPPPPPLAAPHCSKGSRHNSLSSREKEKAGTYAIRWPTCYSQHGRESPRSPEYMHAPQHRMTGRLSYTMKENMPPSRSLNFSTGRDTTAGGGDQTSVVAQSYHPSEGMVNPSKAFDFHTPPPYDSLLTQNHHLSEQLRERDFLVSSLQERVLYLENKIIELRQLPTGKVSHIPIDDMIKIMEEYGSEVSDQTLPMRKSSIKKTSIIRQFRRWNPTFFNFFMHGNGQWVPKLGKEGELKRREEKRRFMKKHQGRNH